MIMYDIYFKTRSIIISHIGLYFPGNFYIKINVLCYRDVYSSKLLSSHKNISDSEAEITYANLKLGNIFIHWNNIFK